MKKNLSNEIYDQSVQLINKAYDCLQTVRTLPSKNVKSTVKKRQKLLKQIDQMKNVLQKNIRALTILDKNLGVVLNDEFLNFCFDEIPLKKRPSLINFLKKINSTILFKQTNTLKQYLKKWVKGELRTREISRYLLQQISN